MSNDVLYDSRVSRLIEIALMEDIGLGDLTTDACVREADFGMGEFLSKEVGVVAGMDMASLVFRYCDQSLTLTPAVAEGSVVRERAGDCHDRRQHAEYSARRANSPEFSPANERYCIPHTPIR